MTGDALRRIREAHGLSKARIAGLAGYMSPSGVRDFEKKMRSFVNGSKGNNKRRAAWLKMLDALSKATGRVREACEAREAREADTAPVDVPPVVEVVAAHSWGCFVPKGTTHLLNGEPVRVKDYHGRRIGFAWDGRDWVRANRVELSRRLEVVQ